MCPVRVKHAPYRGPGVSLLDAIDFRHTFYYRTLRTDCNFAFYDPPQHIRIDPIKNKGRLPYQFPHFLQWLGQP